MCTCYHHHVCCSAVWQVPDESLSVRIYFSLEPSSFDTIFYAVCHPGASIFCSFLSTLSTLFLTTLLAFRLLTGYVQHSFSSCSFQPAATLFAFYDYFIFLKILSLLFTFCTYIAVSTRPNSTFSTPLSLPTSNTQVSLAHKSAPWAPEVAYYFEQSAFSV